MQTRNPNIFIGIWAILITLAPAHAQQIPASLLDALGRFKYGDPSGRGADRLLQELDTSRMSDDRRFLLYRAVALDDRGDKAAAIRAAKAAVASGYVPTLHESTVLVDEWRNYEAPISTAPAGTFDLGKSMEDAWNIELRDYPYGHAEFQRLRMLSGPQERVLSGRFEPVQDGREMPAATAYEKMNMFDSALRIYSRLVAEYPSSRDRLIAASRFWEGMAKCFAAQGKWELAQGYMLKSAVGNGMPPNKRDFFHEMDANMREKREAKVPVAMPDPALLEQIVVWLADAQLFPDAFQAIAELKEAGKTPTLKTQIVLHENIVKMIEGMKKGHYDNVKFRGIDVNDANLAKERQLIEDLKKKMKSPGTAASAPAATNP